MTKAPEDIEAQVKRELEETPYAASSLKLLSGGFTNFIYLATLANPLPDGTTQVAIKHGENYVARWEDFRITTDRCVIASCSPSPHSEDRKRLTFAMT